MTMVSADCCMKTAFLALVLSSPAWAGVAPIPHGPCHVIANNAVSDWLTEDEAKQTAEGWGLLGINARVICRPPKIDRTEWALLAGDATMRALDAYSTRRALEGPNRETTVPMAIAGNTGAMWAYSMGIVAFDWWLVRDLEKHRHHRLATMVPAVDIGIEGSTLRNFELKDKHNKMWRIGQ